MTFINTNYMAEIECELILAKLARKGYGFKHEKKSLSIVPNDQNNVDFNKLLNLRETGEFLPGMEIMLLEERHELEKWYREVCQEEITGHGGKIDHRDILDDVRLWMWLEPTREDRNYYKYAVINAKEWHKTISKAADIEKAHRYAWRLELWEIFKNDCTPSELESIADDIHGTLEQLKGFWSALKFTPKNPRKSQRYDALRRQFGICYQSLQMIQEELFARDKQLEKDRNEHLIDWHPLDEDPIHHERDAWRIRLHNWASWQERHAVTPA